MSVPEGARRLAAGEAIGFPTETVYGLGADATNPAALAKVFALKGRPADHPLIVHIAEAAALDQWAIDVPREAWLLAERFWPGPLTMILAKSPRVPREATGGQDTVGLRCPSHPVAQALLREFERVGSGVIAAPSANRFGHVSPTTAGHVRDEFGASLYLIDGGPCEVGLESTIVDLSRGMAVLLRPGGIARAEIEAALGSPVQDRDRDAPRASGTLAAHYAPRAALVICEPAALEAELAKGSDLAVLALRATPSGVTPPRWITAPFDAVRYGHDLYANLRTLDATGTRRIVVEAPPRSAAWEAVNDRLSRAAAGSAGPDAPQG